MNKPILALGLLLLCGCSEKQENGKWIPQHHYQYYAHEGRIYITDKDKKKLYWIDEKGNEVQSSSHRAYNGLVGYPVLNLEVPGGENPFEWKPEKEVYLKQVIEFVDEREYLHRHNLREYELNKVELDLYIHDVTAYLYSSYNDRLRGMKTPSPQQNTKDNQTGDDNSE